MRGGKSMLKISSLTVEHLPNGCVTDNPNPGISFRLESDRQDVTLKRARITVGDWTTETDSQVLVPYDGKELKPYAKYNVEVTAEDDAGETAKAVTAFETGRMGMVWKGKWISDPGYSFTEKKVSPIPMMFRKKLSFKKKVKQAKLYVTAMGIYELMIDGAKVGDQYFAPGFTSYKHEMQYKTYDVSGMLNGEPDGKKNGRGNANEHILTAVVAGGWAVGSFVFTRVNRFDADRQALLAELRITYEDGSEEIIGSDDTWEVTEDGPYRIADIYDGETYDATIDEEKISWRKAAPEQLKFTPNLFADYGSSVKAHEEMKPVSCKKQPDGTFIYDFGQNFAGVVKLDIKKAAKGQVITVKHAEILNRDGSLNTKFLRTAKATAAYTCRDGAQEYSPRLTYMGFRYISISGIDEADVDVSALALYSDIERTGDFTCSNEMLNRLQQNIIWSSKSNFVDIPTDCPQRDERMGWTGDIAVFAPTACFNFDISRFLDKWLLDVKSEQLPTGGLPNTVLVQGYGFPATMPSMAIDWWGDACVLVPWAQYMAKGNVQVLRDMYPTMKKYVKACRFWAGFGIGKHRYIWHTPSMLHFGDWVAPDVPKMSQWQGRSKWTATASLYNTSRLTGMAADNGQADTAFKMLMNTKCPSWLYEVKSGATTIWERWDGLDENGECPIGDDGTDMMISYNHYASGAVGAFLYQRVAGIEAAEPGYRRFNIRPLVGGGLTSAKASTMTSYGRITSDWKIEGDTFLLDIEVPVGTRCTVTLPDGNDSEYGSGKYHLSCTYKSTI